MTDKFDESNFGAESEMKSQTVDWGKPGDFILGTFVKRRDTETQFGPNSIYEFYAERGSFHPLEGKGRMAKPIDTPTIINKGESWSVWGRGDVFCGMANALLPGQIVKIMYVEDKEGKNGPWKDVKIYAPRGNDGKPLMNQEWLDMYGTLDQQFDT